MATHHFIEQIKELEILAQRNKSKGYCDTARNAMHKAQSIWSPALGIAKPDFSSEDWHELNIEQMERMAAIAEENALSGWESGARAALERARIAWERLAEPRPSRPRISQEARRQLGRMLNSQQEVWTATNLSTLGEVTFSCPICIEDLSGICYKHNSCKKTFCHECLDSWMRLSRTCPLCRQDL